MAGHTVEDLVRSLRTTTGETVLTPRGQGFEAAKLVANLLLDSVEPISRGVRFSIIGASGSATRCRPRSSCRGARRGLLGRRSGYGRGRDRRFTRAIVFHRRRPRLRSGLRQGRSTRRSTGRGPGCGWALVEAVPSGPSVIGAALRGGIEHTLRKSGVLCDSLIAPRIRTAYGEVVDADDDKTPKLMWALRGGGGNSGIVVEATFQAVPAPPLHCDPVSLHRRRRRPGRVRAGGVGSAAAGRSDGRLNVHERIAPRPGGTGHWSNTSWSVTPPTHSHR